MAIQCFRNCVTAVALMIGLLIAPVVTAGTVVTISGNTATAIISVPDVSPATYSATVRIAFDTPTNLTADELNITAQLVDPSIAARLPACLLPLLGCVTIDPAFPVMVTVEPLNLPWLFRSTFDPADTLPGNLSFLNTYEIEIETDNLPCTATNPGDPCTNTPYRLFKAPVNGSFNDYTDDVLKGSVRSRGRDGAFSQFLIAKDTRASLMVALTKVIALNTRVLAASLNSTLQGDLLALVADIDTILLTTLDFTAAIADVDNLTSEIQLHAGIDIANRWTSEHTLVNDAGEMEGLAKTLRYTLVRLQNGQ